MDEYAHFIIGPNDRYDPESKVIERTGVALRVCCLLYECVYCLCVYINVVLVWQKWPLLVIVIVYHNFIYSYS